jgi:phosphoribosyl-AMP cyclohydrolase
MKFMDLSKLNFRHEVAGENLVIAIAQDYKTLEVLMVAHMNLEALKLTMETGNAHYWSTSRKKIWLKGESSGHTQNVKEVLVDCDEDAVLLKVEQNGAACHKGYYSCFFRELSSKERFNLKILQNKVFEPEKTYGEE